MFEPILQISARESSVGSFLFYKTVPLLDASASRPNFEIL